MSIQGIIIAICVMAAFIFIGRKFYRSITSKGCSGCNSAATCRSRNCYGGGACPEEKSLRELKPRH